MVKNYIFLGLYIFMLTSCIKEVSIKIPDYNSLPVVNCLFQSDSLMHIYISYSASTNDFILYPKEINQLVVYENNEKIEVDYIFKEKTIITNLRPKENNIYKLELLVDDNIKVVTSDLLPFYKEFEIIDYISKVGKDDEGDYFSEVVIELFDSKETENYYELTYELHTKYGSISSGDLWSYDLAFVSEDGVEFYYPNLLFSNKFLKQGQNLLRFNFRYEGDEKDIVITLRSVSNNYYKYKKSLALHLDNQEGDIWDGGGNPVTLFSNIENGYGIFAGYQEYSDTIFVNKNR